MTSSRVATARTCCGAALAACEAVPGEIIRGGNGVDTVESPLTRAELEARGVILEDIENVVVVPVLSSSEC